MTEIQIQEVIKSAVREVLADPKIDMQPDTKLIEDLGLESIDFVDIIFEIEQRIKIEIDLNLFAAHLSRFKELRFNEFRVQDLVQFINQSLNGER